MKVGGGLTLGNISGAVDTDEKERHAARIWSLQSAQPMAHSLKADAEAMKKKFEEAGAKAELK